MIDNLKRNKNWRFLAALLVILIGVVQVRVGVTRELTIVVDGAPILVRTGALTVSGALRAGEIAVRDADRVSPERGKVLWNQRLIHVERARAILISTPDEDHHLVTPERVPSNLMAMVGIDLYPEDLLRVNGVVVDSQEPLALKGDVVLQYEPAVPVDLEIDGAETTLFTNQPVLGAALEKEGIRLAPRDWISEPLTSPVEAKMAVSIHRAKPVAINIDETTINGLSAGSTVGEALQDADISLQNLDYSLPPDDAPIPESREITVVRVSEDVIIMTDEVAHGNDYVEDPNTLLDQISVIEPGQVGIYAKRERIRYEDGEAMETLAQDSWQASEPQEGLIGYGSQIVVQSEVVEGETLEFYRKMTVFATAFSPCNLGIENYCSYITYSGLPLEKGIIGVTRRWYGAVGGHRVYVTGYGYGVIGDIGGGYPDGRPWIDLGYSDEEYPGGVRWVTLYFLTPVPDYVPLTLP